VDCQEKCQESSYSQCQSELANDCTTQCDQSGAIFCNGAYVSAGDVNQCVAALNQILTTQITANGEASCSGDQCSGHGTVTCAASGAGLASNGPVWALGAAIAVGIAGLRKRTRRVPRAGQEG